MAESGSALPGGFVLGALSHADRVGLIYEARASGGARTATALVLHPLHLEELQEWFEGNAALGLALRHPNLVEVYAAGETHNGLPVMVTERVEGRTLRARIASSDLLIGSELLRVVRAVASALDYLHARTPPVLHRALMPEHVVTTPDGGVKLLAVGHADRPHHAPAKPAYLSPEELLGAATVPASDVFALASLTFEVLTGRPAFAGDASNVLAAVQRGTLPWVGVVPSEALAPINRVLHRAWSFSPRDRTARAGVFAQELEDALRVVPQSLLSVRRPMREPTPMRGTTIPPPRGLRAATIPPPSQHPPSQHPPSQHPPSQHPAIQAAMAQRTSTRPMPSVPGRMLTPFPMALMTPRAGPAAIALPPPPRVPTSLAAMVLESTSDPGEPPIELVQERARAASPSYVRELSETRTPTQPPPAHAEVPARLRVDTDDAVLILEPSVIEDSAVIDALDDDELPPPEPVVPAAPAANDVPPDERITDVPGRVQVIQKVVVFEPPRTSPAPEPAAPPPAPTPSQLATVSSSAASDELAVADLRRRSWSQWRPQVAPQPAPWQERELRFTPRLLVTIILANVAITTAIVWLMVTLMKR